MPASAYTRAKQPEQVRRALLDHAAAIAMDHGVSGITVQAVAAAAGVTKGGLFHHFGSKQALIEGLFADLLARVDAEIDALSKRTRSRAAALRGPMSMRSSPARPSALRRPGRR